MGAWIGITLIKHFHERIKGFIGIAPAPDFTEELIWKKLNDIEKSLDATDAVAVAICQLIRRFAAAISGSGHFRVRCKVSDRQKTLFSGCRYL